jgi:hypothetical protein
VSDRDLVEQELRIDQMTINIEKMRADMNWEARKFALQAIIATATVFAAGGVVGGLIVRLMSGHG